MRAEFCDKNVDEYSRNTRILVVAIVLVTHTSMYTYIYICIQGVSFKTGHLNVSSISENTKNVSDVI